MAGSAPQCRSPVWIGALAAALVMPAWAGQLAAESTAARADGFGRWESPLRRCQLLWPGPSTGSNGSSCLKLRLDQSVEGMLRVRFINAALGSRFASEELTFAGLLLRSDQPMRCQQGACAPSWPLRMQVHGVASRRFDGRGLAAHVPSNQLAKGRCSLGPDQLVCEAKTANGLQWQASAELPRQGPSRPRATEPAQKRP